MTTQDTAKVREQIIKLIGLERTQLGQLILANLDDFQSDWSSTIDAIMLIVEEVEQQYDDIFSWLLGENGDFPISEKGKRYNWRSELRQRLSTLQAPQKGKP